MHRNFVISRRRYKLIEISLIVFFGNCFSFLHVSFYDFYQKFEQCRQMLWTVLPTNLNSGLFSAFSSTPLSVAFRKAKSYYSIHRKCTGVFAVFFRNKMLSQLTKNIVINIQTKDVPKEKLKWEWNEMKSRIYYQ